eukprot:9072837-Pyramimonas_sp.AAC.3
MGTTVDCIAARTSETWDSTYRQADRRTVPIAKKPMDAWTWPWRHGRSKRIVRLYWMIRGDALGPQL